MQMAVSIIFKSLTVSVLNVGEQTTFFAALCVLHPVKYMSAAERFSLSEPHRPASASNVG